MQAVVALNCNPVRAHPAMAVQTLACPGIIESRVLPALVLFASIAMTVSGAVAQEQKKPFAQECAVKDVAVVALIEDHGAAEACPRIGSARPRRRCWTRDMVCREGRVGEALALIRAFSILAPSASLAPTAADILALAVRGVPRSTKPTGGNA